MHIIKAYGSKFDRHRNACFFVSHDKKIRLIRNRDKPSQFSVKSDQLEKQSALTLKPILIEKYGIYLFYTKFTCTSRLTFFNGMAYVSDSALVKNFDVEEKEHE